jgi:hypothetical protein
MKPVPKQEACLPSAGLDYSRATPHTFTRYQQVALDTLKYANSPRSARPATVLIYTCTETGAERRWGIE